MAASDSESSAHGKVLHASSTLAVGAVLVVVIGIGATLTCLELGRRRRYRNEKHCNPEVAPCEDSGAPQDAHAKLRCGVDAKSQRKHRPQQRLKAVSPRQQHGVHGHLDPSCISHRSSRPQQGARTSMMDNSEHIAADCQQPHPPSSQPPSLPVSSPLRMRLPEEPPPRPSAGEIRHPASAPFPQQASTRVFGRQSKVFPAPQPPASMPRPLNPPPPPPQYRRATQEPFSEHGEEHTDWRLPRAGPPTEEIPVEARPKSSSPWASRSLWSSTRWLHWTAGRAVGEASPSRTRPAWRLSGKILSGRQGAGRSSASTVHGDQKQGRRWGWALGSARRLGSHSEVSEKEELEQDPAMQAASLIASMLLQLEQTRQEPLAVRKIIFRNLQRQLHPDKNHDQEEASKLAFQHLMDHRVAYLTPASFLV